MRALPDELRWQIVLTWKELKSIRATQRALGLGYHVVWHWVSKYKNTLAVQPIKRKGPPHLVSVSAARKAKDLLLSGDCHGGMDVARALLSLGLTRKLLSASTVIRATKRQARKDGDPIRALRGKPAKRLTAKTMLARLAFARLNKKRDWQHVMFTDRKKFLFIHPGCEVKPVTWVRKGERRQENRVNHPMAVNVYAGVTVHGVTACVEVAGSSKHTSKYTNKRGQPAKNITAAEYKDVVTYTLLPEGQRLMAGAGLSSWVFQQDNDPTHKSVYITIARYNSNYGTHITKLGGWPPNSPDLSPIENVWAYVQCRVHRRGCKTFEEFKAAVFQEMASVPPRMLKNLFNSMPKRIAGVIKTGGGKTKY